jgi:cell division septation protein DedD
MFESLQDVLLLVLVLLVAVLCAIVVLIFRKRRGMNRAEPGDDEHRKVKERIQGEDAAKIEPIESVTGKPKPPEITEEEEEFLHRETGPEEGAESEDVIRKAEKFEPWKKSETRRTHTYGDFVILGDEEHEEPEEKPVEKPKEPPKKPEEKKRREEKPAKAEKAPSPEKKPEKRYEPPERPEARPSRLTRTGDISASPDSFIGEVVTLEGSIKLSSRGATGSWYVLFDESGTAVVRSASDIPYESCRLTVKVEKTRLGQTYLDVQKAEKL